MKKTHDAPTSAGAGIHPSKLRLPGTPADMGRPLLIPFIAAFVLMVGVLLAGVFPATLMAQTPRFHLEAKWVIGGLGQWRAMAEGPDSHFLYVTRQDRVIVVDTNAGKQVSAMGGFQSAFGIAFDRNGHGYVSEGGSVVVFDRKENRVIRAVQAGQLPESIVFEPVTNTVWAMDVRGSEAIVIDAATEASLGSVPLGGRPIHAVADDEGAIYAALLAKGSGKTETTRIAKIGARMRKVLDRWPVAGCENPSSLAIDAAGKRLFLVCRGGELAVLNTTSGKVIAALTVGKDAGDAAYIPSAGDLVVANGAGSLQVIKKLPSGKYAIVENVPTLPGARTMAPGADGRRIYLAAADSRIPLHIARQITHPRPVSTPGPFVILVIAK